MLLFICLNEMHWQWIMENYYNMQMICMGDDFGEIHQYVLLRIYGPFFMDCIEQELKITK